MTPKEAEWRSIVRETAKQAVEEYNRSIQLRGMSQQEAFEIIVDSILTAYRERYAS